MVTFYPLSFFRSKQSAKKSEIFSLYLPESSGFIRDNKLFLYLFSTSFAIDHVYFTSRKTLNTK
ncbi:Uncharacterised protein [Vibrio cholerae]|nr:Uncharacterised protein [Vibrio cholerae]CSC57323.1 Uncharacterised protein [Vibrio cholerae]